MVTSSKNSKNYVISYLKLRQALGWLGLTLPVILVIGLVVLSGPDAAIQPSISDYVHTDMGGVFVGVLFAVGAFLFSYKGPEKQDDVWGDLAGACAIGIALFPTRADGASVTWVSVLHLVFAVAFFAIIAYFSICLFTKTDKPKPVEGMKRIRNRVYRVCGWLILISIALVAVYYLVLPKAVQDAWAALKPVFWLETVAVMAFGFSWLTKGEAIWADIENAENG